MHKTGVPHSSSACMSGGPKKYYYQAVKYNDIEKEQNIIF